MDDLFVLWAGWTTYLYCGLDGRLICTVGWMDDLFVLWAGWTTYLYCGLDGRRIYTVGWMDDLFVLWAGWTTYLYCGLDGRPTKHVSIRGRGKGASVFPKTFRSALGPTQPGDKTSRALSWPFSSISCRGYEWRELCFYIRLVPSCCAQVRLYPFS
jgi:hypothetical protein